MKNRKIIAFLAILVVVGILIFSSFPPTEKNANNDEDDYENNIQPLSSNIVGDTTSPRISGEEDIFYEQKYVEDYGRLVWYTYDENPSTYIVCKNGEVILSGNWTNATITCPINRWNLGQYIYKIIVRDLYGNIASDEVIVTIQDTISPVLRWGIHSYDSQTINWTATDNNPASYAIYKNGEIVLSGNWTSGELISIKEVEVPKEGFYNYAIVVVDTSGNSISDGIDVKAPVTINAPVEREFLWKFYLLSPFIFIISVGIILIIRINKKETIKKEVVTLKKH